MSRLLVLGDLHCDRRDAGDEHVLSGYPRDRLLERSLIGDRHDGRERRFGRRAVALLERAPAAARAAVAAVGTGERRELGAAAASLEG